MSQLKQFKPKLVKLCLSATFVGALVPILPASASSEPIAAEGTTETRLLRQPTVSKDHLAFVYGGDIWLSDREGKAVKRLTQHPANEFAPSLSPDGRWIAFSAAYDRNIDVYVMPVSGGEARRLTWHPGADVVVGWSPDSQRILFSSGREIAVSRSTNLFEVSLHGGAEQKVMDAIAFEGNWSADGKYLAYRPFPQAYSGSSGWRQHRGGTTPPIWIIDLKAKELEKIPHVNASDKSPVWIGDDIYFISDRHDGAANLFVYHRRSKQVQQLSKETQWDIRSMSAFEKRIVYEAGGVLKEFDTQSGQTRTLSIDLSLQTAQANQVRPQWKDASPNLTSANLSPTGKRVLVTARGEVFTVPVKDGSVRNLTETSGIREKDAIWSPDGKQIAYLSDAGITHTIVIKNQTGEGKPKTVALGKTGYFTLLEWSPNSQQIVFQDNHLQLFVLNLANSKVSKIDESARRAAFSTSFSSDSRWLAYTVVGDNHFSQIKLFDFVTGKSTTITDGLSDADHPAFAAQDYLYFTASTNAGPTHVGLDMSSQERPLRHGIYAVVLAADGKSPMLPKSGDEEVKVDVKPAIEKKPESANESKKDDASKAIVKTVKIDLKGIEQRIVALPVAERNYSNLLVAHDGALFFLEQPQPGASNEVPTERTPNTANLMRFNAEEKKVKLVRAGIQEYGLSADGKKLLLQSAGAKLEIADASEKIDAKPVSLAGLKMRVDPRAEWQQIFNETWWMQKEFFYDANLHGLDWNGIYQRYADLLKYVQRREDLNELLVEMIGELQVGHNRVGGGDIHQETAVSVGLLGADLVLENDHMRIKTIYQGDRWNPFVPAPLAIPGLDVKSGDYIVAIDGKAVDRNTNIYALLENKVGKQVNLSIVRDLQAKLSHTITVQPIANEAELRQWHWVEKNRDYVQKKTDGKVAYVYLPNTGGEGYQYFNRMFYAQADKSALIIDERRNGGGQAANYITDVLSRPYLAGWKDRDGMIYETPGAAIYGPKAMLIDQDAGSGGDFLPYSFKRLKLGDLIGKRTWGGLIGISANPALIDGGNLVVPFFRFFTPDNAWRVENEGVAPDIDVELDPLAVNQGRDPQLDAAIDNVLTKLKNYRDVKLRVAPPMPTKLGQ
ncbi:S41 family peptidase [Undibacterium fentianense]|uniref:Tricorn protease homolog n=1 Tax=Undibacterium fentianense TaxID=2828728 RepID=A0A941E2X9_9BURK|nr:S41 family peptidase [Undibacterium fentianense]MBR7800082.1 PD40 domain-containing protein [Undibacterium fentianense]